MRFADIRPVHVVLFFLPWQTRLLSGLWLLPDGVSEFTTTSVYAIELLILFGLALRPWRHASSKTHMTVFLGWLALLLVFLQMFHAASLPLALNAVWHVAVAFLLWLTLLDERVSLPSMLGAFSLGLVAPAVLGIMQTSVGFAFGSSWFGLAPHAAGDLGASVVETFSSRWLRAYGSFPHPNIFSGYLAVGVITSVLWIRELSRRAARIAVRALVVLLFVALLLTFSRSAWLGFVLAIAVVGWMLFAHHRAALRRVVPLGLFLLVASALTIFLFSPPFLTRFDPTARLEQQSIEQREAGWSNWRTLMQSGGGERWLFGVGPGQYVLALAGTFPGRQLYAYEPVHNVFLLIIAEVGIAGAFFILAWLFSIVCLVSLHLPRTHAIGALALCLVIFSIAFFDHYLWSLWPGLALSATVLAFSIRLQHRVL